MYDSLPKLQKIIIKNQLIKIINAYTNYCQRKRVSNFININIDINKIINSNYSKIINLQVNILMI